MSIPLPCLLIGLALVLPGPALASEAPPAELRPELAASAPTGQGVLRVWGLEIYEATLWAAPGFSAAAWVRTPLALELRYRRDFKGQDIAQRSLDEMRRQGPIAEAQASAWAERLRELFPDVRRGDRLSGLHRPGVGAAFWLNGRPLGELRDAHFAERFFGIWLSPQTSEPQLRRRLLAQPGAETGGSSAP